MNLRWIACSVAMVVGGFFNRSASDINQQLIEAAKSGKTDPITSLLADQSADVNTVNENGDTALMCASWQGHAEIAQMLLHAGADVNAVNKDGNTALIWASWQGHAEIARMLLHAGADVNAVNKDGNTALFTASWNGHAEIAQMLLHAGADVNSVNENGNTSLMRASWQGHAKIARMLLHAGANVNTVNKDGNTALFAASWQGHAEIARMLLHVGADVNAVNKDESTVLISASWQGHAEIARMLLHVGADVNTVNKYGNTALIWASNNDNTKIIKSLLMAGATLEKASLQRIKESSKITPKEKKQILSVFDALQQDIDLKPLDTQAQQLLHAYHDFVQGDRSQLKELALHKLDVMQRIKSMPQTVAWGSLTYNLQKLFKKESIKPLLYFLADTQRLRNAADEILQEIDDVQQLQVREIVQRTNQAQEEIENKKKKNLQSLIRCSIM